jgi:hypothetical protein
MSEILEGLDSAVHTMSEQWWEDGMSDNTAHARALTTALTHVATTQEHVLAGIERVLKGWLVIQRTKIVRAGTKIQESSSAVRSAVRSGGVERVLVLSSTAYYTVAYRHTSSGTVVTQCDR